MSADQHIYRRLTAHDDLGDDTYHEAVHLHDEAAGGGYVYRDAIGRRDPRSSLGGWCRWLRIRCNNPDCGYTALVRADVIEQVANDAEGTSR